MKRLELSILAACVVLSLAAVALNLRAPVHAISTPPARDDDRPPSPPPLPPPVCPPHC